MTEKFGTYDGVPNICKDENPSKGPVESQVEGKGLSTEGRDGGSIDCLKGEVILSTLACSARGWNDTHLSIGVHEITRSGGAIIDEE